MSASVHVATLLISDKIFGRVKICIAKIWKKEWGYRYLVLAIYIQLHICVHTSTEDVGQWKNLVWAYNPIVVPAEILFISHYDLQGRHGLHYTVKAIFMSNLVTESVWNYTLWYFIQVKYNCPVPWRYGREKNVTVEVRLCFHNILAATKGQCLEMAINGGLWW